MDKEKIQNSCDIQGKENESLQDNDKKVNGVCEDSNTDNQQIKTSTEDVLRKSVVSASQVPDTTSHKEGSVVSDPSRKSNLDSEEQPRTPPASGRKSKASTSSPVMKFMPHPPSRPPSAGPEVTDATTISSASTKSAEALVSGAAVVATTATTKTAAEAVTVTEIKPMAPTPVVEQAPVLEKQEDPVEKQRLAWMKNCVPWSKVSNEPWRLKPNAQRSHKRPSSAKKLPALSEAVILSAAQAETLRQVSSVELTSLPGCSLSTLSQCWSLRYLTVTNCGLICLDGLSQCKHLHYINAEHNNIEHLDLKDLGSLQVLRLAHNRLNIVHGLEGCINLRWLDLSHNRITKLSGLGALRRLHTLRACHNQLVSTEGLEEVVTLQRLELSHNYLQALTKLSRMCLLTILDVSANNLQKVPEFSNQVLLQHLNLRENSIKSLEDCSKCWLPLLESLNCGQNMLENLNGIDKLITLSELDVSSNQITEPEVVTEGLHLSGKLSSLVLEGNPLVDVYFNEYRDILFKALPMVSCIDGVQRQGAADLGPENTDDDFTLMCLSQTAAHKKLAMNFDAQLQEHEVSAPGASDNLCSCFFTFCDTSFKMAAEYRSSHEYGDISVTSSISDFTTTVSTDLSSKMSKFNSTDTDKVTTGDVTDRKSKFEAAVAAQGHLMSSENFPESARSSINGNHSTASVSNNKSKGSQRNSGLSSSVKSVTEKSKLLSSVEAGHTPVLNTGANKKKVLDDSTDSSDSDSEAENDPSLYPSATDHQKRLQVMAPQSAAPTAASYMNEKDKFEMALQGKSTAASHDRNIQHGVNDRRHSKPQNDTLHSSSYGVSSSQHHSSQYSTNNLHSMPDSARLGQKDLFERAVQQQQQTATATPTAVSAKAMFDMAVSGGGSSSSMGIQPETMRARSIPSGGTDFNPQHGVKANVVGNQLMEEPGEDLLNDLDLAALGMDGDFSFDGLDFDIDKYLDMNDLDEFLEKGWRPAESPQIPQSSYPVLGKIGSAESNFNNNHNGMRKPIQDSSLHRTGLGMTAPPPPMQPSHAWKDAPVPELMGKPPRPSPLPAPSPSPSSVASAAETLGGGSIRSKKDELSDEWGFKDSRTAELMMARAKKMKYNAERKRKLSKLDPKQRLQLFRRLEESGKIHPVRPPPAKVLPRKEYFQAREEEVQRQELERRVEEHARVNRTFEWLHTQVGDHPVSSSRINPGPGAMHTHSDSNMSKNPHNFDYGPRKTSPGSDYMDSVSAHGGHGGHRLGRRFSTEEAHAGNSPMLPPIQIGAVPSTHKDERMSWRNEQVDKSLGWGGGKKRGKN
ncbi:leucine-rich repeat and IQ domain-containing protein 1 [Aplysia californica]|uniref:Leucine-rich repeat and IQ domain-containing protein 1 n=1 Tax=Aplysia californica TaxID=6500 RepID=A0ABM1A731_APLCA|nr:leucine-rich repeat and IQ domain-containing protein 1 [Aplysia californica]